MAEGDVLGQELAPGERVGAYRILERIGRGGMGEVYRAEEDSPRRVVALKTVSSAHLRDPQLRRRFVDEIARHAAVAAHPYIAQVFRAFEDRGRVFMAMEFVEGRTLHDRLRTGRASRDEVCRWGEQIALALAAIHAHHLVHRDLKPGNVMITPQGLVKVMDFGIALEVGAPGGEDGATRTQVTHAGAIVGTSAYMSPEQQQGLPLDARSDLFALGVVLWEASSGHHPFRRDTGEATRAAILAEPPGRGEEPGAWRGRRELRRLLLRLLAKERNDRPASADAVAAALARIGRRRVPRWATPAAVAALLVTASIGAGWPDRHPLWPPVHWFEHAWPRASDGQREVLARAHELTREQRAGEAAAVLARAVDADDRFFEALVALAEARRAAGLEAAARDTVDRAERSLRAAGYRGNDLPWLELQLLRAQLDSRTDDQVQFAGAMVRHWPARPGATLDLARALARDGQADRARALLAPVQAAATDREVLLFRAQLLADAGDNEAAVEAIGRAREAFARLGLSSGPAETEDALGYAAYQSGGFPAAARHWAEAVRLFRAGGFAPMATRALKKQGDALVMQGEVAAADACYAQAEHEAAAVGNFLQLAEILTSRGAALRYGDVPRAEAMLRRAIDESRKLGNGETRMRAQGMLAGVLLDQCRADEAEPLARDTLDLAGQYHDVENANNARFLLASIDGRRGHLDRRVEQLRGILGENDGRRGRHTDAAYARISLGITLRALERPAEALVEEQAAIDAYRALKDTATLPFVLVEEAQLLADLGRFNDADAALREAGPAGAGQDLLAGRIATARGAIALQRGEPRAALAALRPLIAEGASGVPEDDRSTAQLLASAAALAAGEPRDAERYARAAAGRCPDAAGALEAQLVLGEALLAGGHIADAAKAAENALDAARRMNRPLSRARAGALLAATRRGAEADAARGAARADLAAYLELTPAPARDALRTGAIVRRVAAQLGG